MTKVFLNSNPNDIEYCPDAKERGIFYNRTKYPTIVYNGYKINHGGMSDADIEKAIANELSKPISIKTELVGVTKKESTSTKISFEGFFELFSAAQTSSFKYFFVLFEDNVEMDEEETLHCVRSIRPNANGLTIRLKQDETKKVVSTFELNERWNLEEIGCYLLIANSETNEILSYDVWHYKSPHIVKKTIENSSNSTKITIRFDKEIVNFSENTSLFVDSNKDIVDGKFSSSGNDCIFESKKLLEGKFTLCIKGGNDGVISEYGRHKLPSNLLIKIDTEEFKKRPQLRIAPESMNFGSVSDAKMLALSIINTGSVEVNGKAKAETEWLSVEPATFKLQPDEKKELSVKIDATGMPNGPYNGKILIQSNAGEFEVAVDFNKVQPEESIIFEPELLDFGQVEVGSYKTLQLKIKGKIECKIISSASWITTEKQSLDCSDCDLDVTVTPTSTGLNEGIIKLVFADKTYEIHVKVEGVSQSKLSIMIIKPTESIRIQTGNFQIIGKTLPNISLKCQEIAFKSDSSGNFSFSAVLIPGLNRIKISAESNGKTAVVEVEIVYAISIQLWLGKTEITVNGQKLSLKTAPTASSPPLPAELAGSTYMPIREVAENLNASVQFDSNTKQVTLTQTLPDGSKNVVELWIGKKNAKINGKDVPLDTKGKLYPTIVQGKTMLPLRFVGEALGSSVFYSAPEKKIELVYPK